MQDIFPGTEYAAEKKGPVTHLTRAISRLNVVDSNIINGASQNDAIAPGQESGAVRLVVQPLYFTVLFSNAYGE